MVDSHTKSVTDYDPSEITPDDVDIEMISESLDSDHAQNRAHAAQLCFSLASQDTHVGAELTPALLGAIDSGEKAMVLKGVFGALAVIAEEQPEILQDDVGPLVDGLSHELPLIRMLAARAVRPVGAQYPDVFIPYLNDLLVVLQSSVETPIEQVDASQIDPDQASQLQSIGGQIKRRQIIVEGIVANLVAAIGETDPDALCPHIDTLVTLLNEDLVQEQAPIIDAIKTIGEEHPETAEVAIDILCDYLNSGTEIEVAHAISALGYIGDSAAVDPLWSVAGDDERDDDIRSMASETAEWIETSS